MWLSREGIADRAVFKRWGGDIREGFLILFTVSKNTWPSNFSV